jgi:tyrosinase
VGIRKNQACLSAAERAAFVATVKALKRAGTYDMFVRQHLDAMCFMAAADPAHRGPAFLPWHREYLRRFEVALQGIDPGVTLPYWDWTAERSSTSSIWQSDFMGGDGDGPNQQVTTGPFAHSTGDWPLNVRDPDETDPFLKRAFGAAASSLPTVDDVRGAIIVTPYDRSPWDVTAQPSFRNRLEGFYGSGRIHNRVHLWVGETMLGCSSPNDPVFWLHHCNIDRIWARWQADHPSEMYAPLAGAIQGHNANDAMWPWSHEANPPTPASVWNHSALGYSYDTDSLIKDIVEATGKVTLLRVHDRGTKYGPREDELDVEVVIGLDTEPLKAFGFQLRNDAEESARRGMLKVLRDAFNCSRSVKIDYTRVGSCNGRIIRAHIQ